MSHGLFPTPFRERPLPHLKAVAEKVTEKDYDWRVSLESSRNWHLRWARRQERSGSSPAWCLLLCNGQPLPLKILSTMTPSLTLWQWSIMHLLDQTVMPSPFVLTAVLTKSFRTMVVHITTHRFSGTVPANAAVRLPDFTHRQC